MSFGGPFISFTAGAAITKGTVVVASGSLGAFPWTTAGVTRVKLPAGVARADVALGAIGSFYAPGSSQVPCIASGAIEQGDLVVANIGGTVSARGTVALATGTFPVGSAETAGVDGDAVYISFIPYIPA